MLRNFVSIYFLEEAEIENISSFEGNLLNKAKETLAFEITKIVHGEESALRVASRCVCCF